MRIRKKSNEPVVRRRLRSDLLEGPKTSRFLYRSSRSDSEYNTGRQTPREAIKPAIEKGLKFWFQRVGLLVLIVALAASLFNIFTLSNKPKVVLLSESHADLLPYNDAAYAKAAAEVLNGSIWNKNKITVNTSKVSDEMTRRFPEINSASMAIPMLSHRPVLYLETAQPALVLMASNGIFVVGDNGKALLKTDSLSGIKTVKLPVVNDQSGLKLQLNSQALPSDHVAFIRTVIAQLGSKGFNVTSMSLPAAANQLDVRIAGQQYYVRFNLQESSRARQQAGTFLATVEHLKKQNITPAEYVDVRVEGRAYYK